LGALARFAWASPNTLLGLALGTLGLPFGARIARGDGAILFLDHPVMSWIPPCGITFGHCILYRRGIGPDDPVRRYDKKGWQRIGDHEGAHVRQYERWGPLFLPVYLVSALAPGTHWMERQADRWAEKPASRSTSGQEMA
jgi:hypothetical protein